MRANDSLEQGGDKAAGEKWVKVETQCAMAGCRQGLRTRADFPPSEAGVLDSHTGQKAGHTCGVRLPIGDVRWQVK